jgi:Mn-dependent DtxR family transcriptional regulator
MVLSAGAMFGLAFLLSPRHGLLPRVRRIWERRRRTQAENLIRVLYLAMEKRSRDGSVRDDADRRFGVGDIASDRQVSPAVIHRYRRLAAARGWLERDSQDPMILTDEGLTEARRVVKNHRLWELFLSQEAKLAADHVHADAEEIEHVLPRHVIARLEQMLEHPKADPHGRPIP